MDELFLILNIAECDGWDAEAPGDGPQFIPAGRRPTVLQTGRDVAEGEVMRLAAAHPEGRFALFTLTHVACSVPHTTHVNVLGQPLQQRLVMRLMPIAPPLALGETR